MPDQSVNCCVTSPPYFGLRDYGVAGQIGLEATPDTYVAELVAVFAEVRRVLRDDGTLWLNLGDSFWGSGQGFGDTKTTNKGHSGSRERKKPEWANVGLKPKDLIGIPWRVAFALQADGWYLRRDIIWHKPNPMPESVTDRCTSAHEYIFHFSKSPKYYYDAAAIAEDGVTGDMRRHAGFNDRWDAMSREEQGSGKRNKRSVWTVATKPFKGAHFATFPPKLIEPCILAGCPIGGVVLDPFGGAGTTGLVATGNGRNAILIELNAAYGAMAGARIARESPPLKLPEYLT